MAYLSAASLASQENLSGQLNHLEEKLRLKEQEIENLKGQLLETIKLLTEKSQYAFALQQDYAHVLEQLVRGRKEC